MAACKVPCGEHWQFAVVLVHLKNYQLKPGELPSGGFLSHDASSCYTVIYIYRHRFVCMVDISVAEPRFHLRLPQHRQELRGGQMAEASTEIF